VETEFDKQDKLFDNLKSQNNLLLGFVIIFMGILVSKGTLAKGYLTFYASVFCSLIFSICMFYLSMNILSRNIKKNNEIIVYSRILMILSISFLFSAIMIFFYISFFG